VSGCYDPLLLSPKKSHSNVRNFLKCSHSAETGAKKLRADGISRRLENQRIISFILKYSPVTLYSPLLFFVVFRISVPYIRKPNLLCIVFSLFKKYSLQFIDVLTSSDGITFKKLFESSPLPRTFIRGAVSEQRRRAVKFEYLP
jgi:hypothetical protein